MNNNILLSLGVSILSVAVITFVVVMIFYKIYIKIRSCFNITVNCWFCNENTKVPYMQSNSWTCPTCDQYNGFTKDGDYNRLMHEQFDCSQTSLNSNNSSQGLLNNGLNSTNGFCGACNEAQRLKIEKLAKFEPRKESRFTEELKIFKEHLEKQYVLCSMCERHLNKVLREKRKMVLGSKFLDTLIKGTYSMKQHYLNQLQFAKRQQWKQKYRLAITLLSIINIVCIYESLPTFNKEDIVRLVGTNYGIYVFTIISHMLAFLRVLHSYWQSFCQTDFIMKLGLFIRTLVLMIMYSLGLRITHMNMSSLFCSMYPSSVLLLAFAHQVIDGFRLSSCTFLMTVWSVFTSGLWDFNQLLNVSYFQSFMSLVTLVLMYASKGNYSLKMGNNSHNSFHKLYSDDYFSDDDETGSISCGDSYTSFSKSPKFTYPASPLTTNTTRQPSPVNSMFNLHHYSSGVATGIQRENAGTPFLFRAPKPTYCRPNNCRMDYNNCNFGSSFSPDLSSRSQAVHNAINYSTYNEPGTMRSHTTNAFFSPVKQSLFFGNADKLRSYRLEAMNTSTTESPFAPHSRKSYMNDTYNNHSRPFSACINNNENNCATRSIPKTSNISWTSNPYFNQPQINFMQPIRPNIFNINKSNTNENASRASSSSSGFESQHDLMNASRENSLNRDIIESQQCIATTDNSNGFQNVDKEKEKNAPTITMNKSNLLKSSTLHLSSLGTKADKIFEESNTFQTFIPQRSVKRNESDIFNLHQINDQLLTIRSNNCQISSKRKDMENSSS